MTHSTVVTASAPDGNRKPVEKVSEVTLHATSFAVDADDIESWRVRFSNLHASDSAGYKSVTEAIRKCREARADITKHEKSLKKPANDYRSAVQAEADALRSLILAVEQPLKAIKDEVDAEKAREKDRLAAEERQRLVALQEEINSLARSAIQLVNAPVEDIKNRLEQISLILLDAEEFGDLYAAAESAQKQAIEDLKALIVDREARAHLDAIRAEEEHKAAAEMADQKRQIRELQEANTKKEKDRQDSQDNTPPPVPSVNSEVDSEVATVDKPTFAAPTPDGPFSEDDKALGRWIDRMSALLSEMPPGPTASHGRAQALRLRMTDELDEIKKGIGR